MKHVFLTVLQVLWQLPQDTVGLLVMLFTRAFKVGEFWATTHAHFGVSLGHFIIFGVKGNNFATATTLAHECGHQKQSLYLGWFYLLVIGLPSIVGNVYHRVAHRKWTQQKRVMWYYSQPWEAWADRLGGVER